MRFPQPGESCSESRPGGLFTKQDTQIRPTSLESNREKRAIERERERKLPLIISVTQRVMISRDHRSTAAAAAAAVLGKKQRVS